MSDVRMVCRDFFGNVRRDRFGRFIVDTCESDVDHLQHSVAKPGNDRALCRQLVEDAFAPFEGCRGMLKVTIEFEPEEGPKS